MSNHTKGPWKATGNTIHTSVGVVAVTARNNTAFHFQEGVASSSDRANARLISAAPELLEALRDLLQYHRIAGISDKSLFDAGISAMNKAEGKEYE